MANFIASAQQQAIFDWFNFSSPVASRHLIARARAGCGKTTTILKGVVLSPESKTGKVLIAAFSKIIETEITKKLADSGVQNIIAKTLHAVGYACIRNFRERIKVEFTSDRADRLALAVCGNSAPDAIVRLVSKLHTKGREIAPHATKVGDLTAIAITFDCEPDEQWAERFDLRYVEEKALEAMVLASAVKSGDTIDGSDMIFLPVRNGWLSKQYDMVVVDEAQDMTTAQLEIAQGVLKTGGRICVVGDDRQAIFGFRGADSGSLDRLKAEMDAAELGLTTTYRCGKAIVALAQGYVSDFTAGESNPEGAISTLNSSKLVGAAGPGDFILSRTNAPLVSTAMQLLRAGKRARVAGRDIGKSLSAIVRKMKAKSVPDLLAKIENWMNREVRRHQAQLAQATNGRKTALQAKIDAVIDQAEMLTSLCDGAKNTAEVESRVEALFVDDGLGKEGVITCSSVHRAKGLEANRVFLIAKTFRGGSVEEENIAYVAITRAKQELVWVSDEAPVEPVAA
jgi:DNA helicase-2/ATP-dependent DNA helicase PcrA